MKRPPFYKKFYKICQLAQTHRRTNTTKQQVIFGAEVNKFFQRTTQRLVYTVDFLVQFCTAIQQCIFAAVFRTARATFKEKHCIVQTIFVKKTLNIKNVILTFKFLKNRDCFEYLKNSSIRNILYSIFLNSQQLCRKPKPEAYKS